MLEKAVTATMKDQLMENKPLVTRTAHVFRFDENDYYLYLLKVQQYKIEFYLLNSLINSPNIDEEFLSLMKNYPIIKKLVPLILYHQAWLSMKREIIKEEEFIYIDYEYHPHQYLLMLRNAGILSALEQGLIRNFYDYMLMNNTEGYPELNSSYHGQMMLDVFESYLQVAGLNEKQTYYRDVSLNWLSRRIPFSTKNIDEDLLREEFPFIFINKLGIIYLVYFQYLFAATDDLDSLLVKINHLLASAEKVPFLEIIFISEGEGWNLPLQDFFSITKVSRHLYTIEDLEHNLIPFLMDVTDTFHCFVADYLQQYRDVNN